MANTLFDAFTQGVTRQQAFAAPVAAEDRKRKKHNKNNGGDKKKIFARCKGQRPDCEAFAQENCFNNAACLAATTACCDLLDSCEFTAFVTCVSTATAP